MGTAAPEVQWTMNFCLAGIGIHFPKRRKRAIAIGEKLGIYRDFPVSRGGVGLREEEPDAGNQRDHADGDKDSEDHPAFHVRS